MIRQYKSSLRADILSDNGLYANTTTTLYISVSSPLIIVVLGF